MILCEIITPNGLYKSFNTSMLNVVTIAGERGILPRHTPLVTMLEISKLTSIEDEVRYEYAISGGLLYFEKDVAKILCDSIESKQEIDLERAKEAKVRAEKHLKSPDSDYIRAELALKKALNRIKVKNG